MVLVSVWENTGSNEVSFGKIKYSLKNIVGNGRIGVEPRRDFFQSNSGQVQEACGKFSRG